MQRFFFCFPLRPLRPLGWMPGFVCWTQSHPQPYSGYRLNSAPHRLTMPETIQVTLPDGSRRDVPRGTTPYDIAKSISPRLADAALAAKIRNSAGGASAQPTGSQEGDKGPASMHAQQSKDGWLFADLSRPLEESVELRLLTEKDPEVLDVYRHSSAHLMASAVL